MDFLRIGVFGVGHFGRFHTLKLRGAGRVRLAGLHDPDAARAATVAAEAGCPALESEALLAASDAVIIATPTLYHARLAEMALVRLSRLSVQPVTDAEWAIVLEMAGT